VSVEQTGSIDVISIDVPRAEVVLTVSDHLDWSNEVDHYRLIQTKLNSYLRFVESGEIFEHKPEAKNMTVVFRIVFKYAPNQRARQFLMQLSKVVESAGFCFRYEIFAASYDN
jgi:hypothetical protein